MMNDPIRKPEILLDSLLPPELFQAPNNILDLQNINPGDPIVVSVHLSDARMNEEITVYFGESHHVVYTVRDPSETIYDTLFVPGNLPETGSNYEVWYVFRNQTSPKLKIEFIDSSKDLLEAFTYKNCSLYGIYPKGLINAWIVETPYRLTQSRPVIRAIDDRKPDSNNLILDIMRSDNKIGNISYYHGDWNVDINDDVDLDQGDLISIQLTDSSSFLNFSVSL